MILLETVDDIVQVSIGALTWIGHTGHIEVEEEHVVEVRNALHLAGQMYVAVDDGDQSSSPVIVEDADNGSI